MVDIVTAENRHRFAKPMASMFEDRKRVFVDLFRWELMVIGGRFEIDQFDDAAAVYLLISDRHGNHQGSLRLLCTDRPHLLGSIFPQLCPSGVPAGTDTREITRLCVCPRLPGPDRLRIRNQLISAMVDYALVHGIRTLTGVVSQRFRSRIQAMGWQCEALGPAQVVNGSTIGAFRIHIGAATPSLLQTTGIYTPAALSAPARIAV